MARKIATGDAKPEQCVNLSTRLEYQKNLQEIRQLLREGVEIGAKGTIVIEETGVTYIHPASLRLEIVMSSREALSPKLKEFFLEAVSIATDAYRHFRVVDIEKAKRIADRYTKFRKRWREAFRKMLEKEVLAGIEKISVNGFYISRLLVKPLPT
jgi:phosphate uptake regulator